MPERSPERYQPPGADLVEPDVGPSDDELARFVGQNAEKYLARWKNHREGRAALAGFNWSAFFGWMYWFVYRRMYVAAAISLAITWLLSALFWHGKINLGVFQLAALLTVSPVAGFSANLLYLRKAERAIAAAKLAPSGDLLKRVAQLGGVRPYLVFGFFLALALVPLAWGIPWMGV